MQPIRVKIQTRTKEQHLELLVLLRGLEYDYSYPKGRTPEALHAIYPSKENGEKTMQVDEDGKIDSYSLLDGVDEIPDCVFSWSNMK